MKPSESGFFVPYNVKDIHAIKTGNGWAILVGINNGKMRIFSAADKTSGSAGLAFVR